ncbi:hypothetical protein GEMRC1_006842 [Eukaryota sp. GEM-RC1]
MKCQLKEQTVHRIWDNYRRRGGLPDPRITSLPVFLLSLGGNAADYVGNVISRETWIEHYPEKDLTDVHVRADIDRALGNQKSILTSLDDLGELYSGFVALTNSAYHLHQSLEDSLTNRPIEATDHLVLALQYSLLVPEAAKSTVDLTIQDCFRTILFKLYKESFVDLSRSRSIPNLLDSGKRKLVNVLNKAKFLSNDWLVTFLMQDVVDKLEKTGLAETVRNEILQIVTSPPPILSPPSKVQQLNDSLIEGLDVRINEEVNVFVERNADLINILSKIKEEYEPLRQRKVIPSLW